MNEAWLRHRVVQAILHRLVDYVDRTPVEERTRPPGFRINPDSVPDLFSPPAPGDDAYIWGLIRKLKELGWIRLKVGRVRPGVAEYETEPYVSLVPEKETDVRALLNRHERPVPYAERWREALLHVQEHVPGSIERFAAQPIRIPGREPDEIIEQLVKMISLGSSGLYLREVSARLFWGLSKVLDNRDDAIAALLGVPECPFAERSIIVHAHMETLPSGVLFIENETSYAAACREHYSARYDLALVFASGFRSTATRLRAPGGSSVYFSEQSLRVDGAAPWFLERLRENRETEYFFWGDLDFAGMSILKSLRESFPRAMAWQKGYQPMLESLQEGGGHVPTEASKQGQQDPGNTGCEYADTELLPTIRGMGRFIDQEAFLLAKNAGLIRNS